MKRLFTFVMTMLLGASLAFAQAGGAGSTGGQDTGKSADTGKKAHKGGKKAHKGGKKSKKGEGADTGTAPK